MEGRRTIFFCILVVLSTLVLSYHVESKRQSLIDTINKLKGEVKGLEDRYNALDIKHRKVSGEYEELIDQYKLNYKEFQKLEALYFRQQLKAERKQPGWGHPLVSAFKGMLKPNLRQMLDALFKFLSEYLPKKISPPKK